MPFHKQHNIRTYTWDEGGRNFQASKITNIIAEGDLQYQGSLEGSIESCCGSVMSYRSVWLKTGANILWAWQVFSFAFDSVMPSDHKYFH